MCFNSVLLISTALAAYNSRSFLISNLSAVLAVNEHLLVRNVQMSVGLLESGYWCLWKCVCVLAYKGMSVNVFGFYSVLEYIFIICSTCVYQLTSNDNRELVSCTLACPYACCGL